MSKTKIWKLKITKRNPSSCNCCYIHQTVTETNEFPLLIYNVGFGHSLVWYHWLYILVTYEYVLLRSVSVIFSSDTR